MKANLIKAIFGLTVAIIMLLTIPIIIYFLALKSIPLALATFAFLVELGFFSLVGGQNNIKKGQDAIQSQTYLQMFPMQAN